MARNSDADQATLRAVYTAAQEGNHLQAAGLAEAALAGGLEHPLLLNVVALKLEQQGRVADAQGLLHRAVQIAPDDVGSRNALGLCLLRLGLPRKALAQFAALIRLNPSLPFAHVSHGNALLALGGITEAEASYQRALALDADQGVALARLAHIAVSRGAYPEARAWAAKALAVLPGYPDAVMSLATAELGERNLARAETGIRALLADARLAGSERAYANGVFGDILDAANRPAEAFAAYTECNEELRRAYSTRFAAGANALEYVRSMTGYFERTRPDLWKPAGAARPDGSGVRGHVFLLGFPRSGTTLLEVILEGHPDVASLEERESMMDSVHEFMRRPEDLDALARATPATLDRLRAAYWRRVAEGGVDVAGKVFVDKYPLNSLKLPLIARLFPNAKILFACRDPRDIVLSCFRHRFRMSAPLYELLSIEGAARYYDAVMGLVLRANGMLTLDTCLVRHEDIVTAFAREMKRICGYLGLEWAPAMGDFALRTKTRAVLTPSTAQLVRGLNTEGLGQWHRYRAFLEPVLPLLEPWVKRFYYDT
ncbi:MAG: sulfotransferase [Steroidobacteraceae bacterium]|jgi:tetratricopeptide (TPR) repeat protein